MNREDVLNIFAGMCESFPDSVGSVVCGGKSADGLFSASEDISMIGGTGNDQGPVTGSVTCSLADIDMPETGSEIVVRGSAAIIDRALPDAVGALVRIYYHLQKSVEIDPQAIG